LKETRRAPEAVEGGRAYPDGGILRPPGIVRTVNKVTFLKKI